MNRFLFGNRRRNILSNPRVQIRIILLFVFLSVMFAATNWYVSKGALRSLYNDIAAESKAASIQGDLQVSYDQQGATLNAQLMLLTALSFVVLTLAGIFLSHTIGGPVYRLTRYLRDVAEGKSEAQRLRLRKHDFFHDLCDSFNAFQQSRGIIPKEPAAGPDSKTAEQEGIRR
jgi:methyl-accepting chemotaxis protein